MSNNHPINPNLAKAKRRGGPRPKSKNAPAEHFSSTLKWVEPLNEPVQVDSPFEFHLTDDSTIRFEVDYLLPDTIAEPYRETVDGLIYRTVGDRDLVPVLQEGLTGLAYFKSARKLYGTLDDPAKSALQSLKAVWYDTLEVPSTMSRLIDSIGNFDTTFGKAKYRYQRLTFLRWVALGLAKTHSLSDMYVPPQTEPQPETFVWKDEESLDLIHSTADRLLKEIRETTHGLNFTVGEEEFTLDASLPDWKNNYTSTAMFPNEDRQLWRSYGLCRSIELRHFDPTVALPPGTPAGWDLTRLLQDIGLAQAPATYSLPAMRDGFNTFQRRSLTRVLPHLRAYFKMMEAPHGERGYAAQLLSSTEHGVTSMFEVSHADAATGFILNPCISASFEPEYIAYSKISRASARYGVSSAAMNEIAH